MNNGWIKIHRSMLDWEWYDDKNTKILFLHCLLKANHKPKKYRGKLVESGVFLTSREALSRDTGLSERQVRTALDNLKATNELTIVSSRQGTMIQVNNYEKYQSATNETTNERPTNDQRTTSNKNEKKEKKEKNTTSAYSFNSFWLAYDKKVGRADAEKKWNRLSEADKRAAMQSVASYVQSTPDKQYRKNASTWINQRCWEDDIEPKQLTSSALLEASGLNPDGTFKV